MRTVNYSDVLRGSAGLAGLGPADIGTGEFALLRQAHDRRLQQAWEWHDWPDLCRVEERGYYPDWDASATYAEGDIRYYADGYYESLQDANTNHLPTDTDWWEAAEDYDRVIALEQTEDDGTELTAIGEALGAYTADPLTTTLRKEVSYALTHEGVQFGPDAPARVWLYLRLRRPVLGGSDWDAAATYAAGDQVYWAAGSDGLGAGNFYACAEGTSAGESPATTAAKWAVVELPYIFRGWLIQAGYADWLTGDGQGDKALRAEQLALQYLELEADKLQRQQNQTKRFNWIH